MSLRNNSKLQAHDLRDDTDLLLWSLGSVFFWGLIAHAYGFFNGLFSHDSLNALYADSVEEDWKLGLGRFMVPIYRSIVREGVAMPWLIGVLALIYIGLTVYFAAKLFDLRSKAAVVLLGGIYATNLTVTALTGTYIYELDFDMLTALMITFSVYCWDKYPKGFLFSAPLIAMSAGFYQAYESIGLVLIVIVIIVDLLNGKAARDVLIKALKGIGMILIGVVLYLAALKVSAAITGVHLSGGYNSPTAALAQTDKSVFAWIIDAYRFSAVKMVDLIPVYRKRAEFAVNALLAAGSIAILIGLMRSRKIKAGRAAAILILGALLPLFMNILYVIGHGVMHDLMILPYYCLYILVIFLIFRSGSDLSTHRVKAAACILIFVLLLGNIRSSNGLYLKKDLEQKSTLSVMTRVADRIESYPDYVSASTPVAIFGRYAQATIPGFEEYSKVTGADVPSALSTVDPRYYFDVYEAYFKYILDLQIRVCDDDLWHKIKESPELRAMPVFPSEGCMTMMDGVLVVKMNDEY